MIEYKVLYIVAETVRLKSKAKSGTIRLEDHEAIIEGTELLRLRSSDITGLRIYRQHHVGTIIHLKSASESVYLTVPRINLFGLLAMVNRSKTRQLFNDLEKRSEPVVDESVPSV